MCCWILPRSNFPGNLPEVPSQGARILPSFSHPTSGALLTVHLAPCQACASCGLTTVTQPATHRTMLSMASQGQARAQLVTCPSCKRPALCSESDLCCSGSPVETIARGACVHAVERTEHATCCPGFRHMCDMSESSEARSACRIPLQIVHETLQRAERCDEATCQTQLVGQLPAVPLVYKAWLPCCSVKRCEKMIFQSILCAASACGWPRLGDGPLASNPLRSSGTLKCK